jgi:hypothetical protein
MADGKIDKERQRLVFHYQQLAEKNTFSINNNLLADNAVKK